jgi:hypothetical protein
MNLDVGDIVIAYVQSHASIRADVFDGVAVDLDRACTVAVRLRQ